MATPLPHIDGYDWDISDEPITYPDRDVADACRRALQWCREQAPHLRADTWRSAGVAPVPTGDGWVHVGDVIAWDSERRAIHWQPVEDRVRVERHVPADRTITLPPLPPIPPDPILPPLPERPDDTIEIPIAKLIELLQQAVKVRRDRITDPLVSRQQAVTYGIGYRPYRVKVDGWVRIGAVADAFADVVLGVFWHPETGGLRMERP